MRKGLLLSLALLLGATIAAPAVAAQEHDIVIYGGTSAGVAAAVQAKKQGKTVIIVSPDKHLGGLTAGGLGWTDSGDKAVIGGVSRDFYRRIKKHYDKPEVWVHQKREAYKQYRADEDGMFVFEPKVAEATFEAWIKENDIPVVRDAWLDRAKGVTKNGQRITSITTLDGKTYAGKFFIDATYEGDLMAAAGVTFTTGREPNSKYGETMNGVQTERAKSHQFVGKIDPYVIPGDPKSGLLPRIHGDSPGVEGEGDKKIQAYNFRTCLTNVAENRVPFPKPEGYDAKQYELLLRTLEAGARHIFGKFDPAPNGKTDTNNHGSFSTDNIGMNYDYPEATYERRKEIIKEHITYQQGFYWFLCNDPRVPEDVRKKMNQWGLAKDEFTDSGNWPHQIYVREARRMVGDFVIAEPHLKMTTPTPDSIGMGSYNMDSHHVQRYVAKDADGKGYARNEGDIQVSPGGPYPISYRAIVPKTGETENLLVPVCVSSSHIAYGSIRMEPVFMVLGQSAASAAVIALDDNLAAQKVPYEKLKARLVADGQVLEYARKPRPGASAGQKTVQVTDLPGVVIDDQKAVLTGEWKSAAARGPFVAEGYQHDDNADKGKLSAKFQAELKQAGKYEVRLAYSAGPNRAKNVPVTVRHAGGDATSKVNQQETPKIDGLWVSLGTFDFAQGKPAVVEINTAETDGHVIIDAVQFLPVK